MRIEKNFVSGLDLRGSSTSWSAPSILGLIQVKGGVERVGSCILLVCFEKNFVSGLDLRGSSTSWSAPSILGLIQVKGGVERVGGR